MKTTKNVRLVDTPGSSTQETVNVHLENPPAAADGSVTEEKIAAGAVTTEKVADKAITKDKIADGTIPEAYTLPAAAEGTLGGVKQVAHVADPAGETPTKAEYIKLRDALVTSGLMKSA